MTARNIGFAYLICAMVAVALSASTATTYALLILGNIWIAVNYVTYGREDEDESHTWTAPEQRADQDYSAAAASLTPAERAQAAMQRIRKKP